MKTTFIIQKLLAFLSLMLTLFFLNACDNGSEDEPEPESKSEIIINSPANGATYVIDWGGAWPEEERMPIKVSVSSDVQLALVRVLIYIGENEKVFEKNFFITALNLNEFEIDELYYSSREGEYQLIIETNDVDGLKTESDPITFYFQE